MSVSCLHLPTYIQNTRAVVGLQNSGQLIPNNSIVNTEAIGVDLDSVLCFTDLEDCCAAPENMELGQWLLPDGTVVTDDMDNVLFETRQGSAVGLNRGMVNGNVTSGIVANYPGLTGRLPVFLASRQFTQLL